MNYNRYTAADLKDLIAQSGLQEVYANKYGKAYTRGTKSQLVEFCKMHNVLESTQLPEVAKPKFKTPLPLKKGEVEFKKEEGLPSFLKEDKIEIENTNDGMDEVNEEDLQIKNQNAKLKIQRYFDRFHWLKDVAYECDENDYIKKLEIVESKLSNYNTSRLVSSQFLSLTSGLEHLSNKYLPKKYINLNGFTNNLARNEELYDLLDEITIKYSDTIANLVSPEKRLCLLMCTTAYITTQKNNLSEELKELKKKEVKDESILKESADL